MAIYVIEYKANGFTERVVRLYNDKNGDIKDIRESDLQFLSGTVKMENAYFKDGKLKGNFDKVLNEPFFVVLGGYNLGTDDAKYKVVNSHAETFVYSKSEMIKLFAKSTVQNATLVGNKYIRGTYKKIPELGNLIVE